jgi:hypothetical protein
VDLLLVHALAEGRDVPIALVQAVQSALSLNNFA